MKLCMSWLEFQADKKQMRNEVHILNSHLNTLGTDAVHSCVKSRNKGCLFCEELCFGTARTDVLNVEVFKQNFLAFFCWSSDLRIIELPSSLGVFESLHRDVRTWSIPKALHLVAVHRIIGPQTHLGWKAPLKAS